MIVGSSGSGSDGVTVNSHATRVWTSIALLKESASLPAASCAAFASSALASGSV